MNWFEKHLHWSILFGVIAIFLVIFLIGIIIGLSGIADTFADRDFELMGAAIYIVLLLILLGWVLFRKNRSLVWLLMIFVPLGG